MFDEKCRKYNRHHGEYIEDTEIGTRRVAWHTVQLDHGSHGITVTFRIQPTLAKTAENVWVTADSKTVKQFNCLSNSRLLSIISSRLDRV